MEQYKNTVYHGDCLEFMRSVPDGFFDLVLTDPPYGIGMDGGNVGYKGFNNFEKKNWDNETPTQVIFEEIFRISRNQIIFGGNYFSLPPTRGFFVWDKGEGFYNRTYAECEFAWTSFDKNAQIFKRDPLARGDYKGKVHPTQKPLELMKACLNYAKAEPHWKIFDPFLGSGTTSVACASKGMDWWGCELEQDYVDVANSRLSKLQVELF